MIKGNHYIDGNWVDPDNLKISAFDLSVVRGFGIFDFLRTYHNRPFRLDAHIDRLFNSAKLLEIAVPKTREEIHQIIQEGLRKNNFSETAIKIVVTGGMSEDSITPGEPSCIIMFTPAPVYPTENYEKGIAIIAFPGVRSMADAKSLNYLSAIVALRKAKAVGAKEALYFDAQRRISECTRSNIFFIKNNELVTTKNDILFGITRSVIGEIAKALQINFVEREIKTDEFSQMDEAFISGSGIEIVPVVKIDEVIIGKGHVGDITKKIMKKFKEMTVGNDQ